MKRTKGERRAVRRFNAVHAPRGGTVGAQRKLLETQRGYAGHAKKFVRRRRGT